MMLARAAAVGKLGLLVKVKAVLVSSSGRFQHTAESVVSLFGFAMVELEP
jgi:broad specificity phosphatase PhoE